MSSKELNTAYGIEKTHNNVESKPAGSKQGSMSLKQKTVEFRGKTVKVDIEFPVVADEKNEIEFQRLLKKMWLEKFEIGSGQNGKSALHFMQSKAKGGNGYGYSS